jgi:GDP-mannose 6-dehydrogenase
MSTSPSRPAAERVPARPLEQEDGLRKNGSTGGMRIGIIGLGPVGAITAACLSSLGHTIIGAERDPVRAARFADGIGPGKEPDLNDMLAEGIAASKIQLGTLDDVAACEMSLVCVGTPVAADGHVEVGALNAACTALGTALQSTTSSHIVVLRSTVPPGTTTAQTTPTIRAAAGQPDLPIAFWPEFLREAVAIEDFMNPSITVFGVDDEIAKQALCAMIEPIDSEPYCVNLAEAESVKMISNGWHAAKAAFANEIGRVLETTGANSATVMELFCKDTKLNISPRYLRPGFAYGGSCLPKDLRALSHMANTANVEAPLLQGIAASNRAHIEQAAEHIANYGSNSVALLGVAFKPGTDDIRESPSLELAGMLEKRGIEIRLHDPLVDAEDLPPTAGNLSEADESIFRRLPELLAPSLEAAIADVDLIVVIHDSRSYWDALLDMSEAPVVSIAQAVLTGAPPASRAEWKKEAERSLARELHHRF